MVENIERDQDDLGNQLEEFIRKNEQALHTMTALLQTIASRQTGEESQEDKTVLQEV